MCTHSYAVVVVLVLVEVDCEVELDVDVVDDELVLVVNANMPSQLSPEYRNHACMELS